MGIQIANQHGTGRNDVFAIDPRDLVIDWSKNLSRGGAEPTVDENLISLAQDMMPKKFAGDSEGGTSGQLNPILVRLLPDRRAELVGGFRRTRAALYLQESGLCPDFKLKAVIVKMSDAEAALVNISENLQREDPQPIQMAHAIRSLLEDYMMPMPAIAGRLKRSEAYLNRLLDLVQLPAAIQGAVVNGELSVNGATELAKLPEKVAIAVYNEAKEANGKKVKAKDLKADKPAKPVKVNAVDVQKVVQKKADAAINNGEAPPAEAKPKRRQMAEVMAFFADREAEANGPKRGKDLAKAVGRFARGEMTEEQLIKVWDKLFQD